MNFKSIVALALIGLLLLGSYFIFSMDESQEESTKTTQNNFKELLARLQAEEETPVVNAEGGDEASQEPTQIAADSDNESLVVENDQETGNCEQLPREEN